MSSTGLDLEAEVNSLENIGPTRAASERTYMTNCCGLCMVFFLGAIIAAYGISVNSKAPNATWLTWGLMSIGAYNCLMSAVGLYATFAFRKTLLSFYTCSSFFACVCMFSFAAALLADKRDVLEIVRENSRDLSPSEQETLLDELDENIDVLGSLSLVASLMTALMVISTFNFRSTVIIERQRERARRRARRLQLETVPESTFNLDQPPSGDVAEVEPRDSSRPLSRRSARPLV